MKETWLDDHTILKVKSGSHASGTNLKMSDTDVKGICIPPVAYHLGFQQFESYQFTTSEIRNTSKDVDETISSLNKFFMRAMAGNPNFLEMLFVRNEDVIKNTVYGEQLRKYRELFLSDNIMKSFGGIALQQKIRIMKDQSQLPELVELYGYDTKKFAHAMRLYGMAIECFENGTFETFRPNAGYLKELRLGLYSKEDALQILDETEEKFKHSFQLSGLPTEPDKKRLEEILIDLTEEALKQSKKQGFLQ